MRQPGISHEYLPAPVAVNGVNPFGQHVLQRYKWAWDQLHGVPGPHLDVGCGPGRFLQAFVPSALRFSVGVEVNPSDLALAVRDDGVGPVPIPRPAPRFVRIGTAGGLPFGSSTFASVSLLDVLEHTADPASLLNEAARVVTPGGLVVITVPAKHVFTFLDPDNLKFRLPRLHRWAWRRRHGQDAYQSRFVDRGNAGLFGDMSPGALEHTNYEPAQLAMLLGNAGLLVHRMQGSGIWFRWVQIPSLLLSGGPARWFEGALVSDGQRVGPPGTGLSRRANLFVVAVRPRP